MNEGSSDQLVKESGFREETMGGEDPTALPPVCDVAAVDGEGIAQDRGGQKAHPRMEKGLEEAVLLESQLPSIGMKIMEIRSLSPKEKVEAEAGDPVVSELDIQHQPPRDWLEPLEDDDGGEESDNQTSEADLLRTELQVNGKWRPEMKNRKNNMKMDSNGRLRRRRQVTDLDSDWMDWPVLGEGWKRKEVFRRSGFSVGKTDTYYKSPSGERVRSKIEMTKYLAGSIDISMFDYKSGVFLDQTVFRKMKRRKEEHAVTIEDGAASELSLTTEKTGGLHGSHTPSAVPIDTHSLQLIPPRVVVIPQKTVSPRFTVTALQSSVSPGSPGSRCAFPHPVKAASSPVGTPPRRRSDSSPLHLADFFQQKFDAPALPSGDFPRLSLPWLDPPLVPLSPTSSPEQNHDPPLQSHSLGGSKVPVDPKQPLSPHSVAQSPDPVIPLNGVTARLNFELSESHPSSCMNCGRPFHDEEFGGPGSTPLCPSCRTKEKQIATRNIVFRKVGHGQWILAKASESKERGGVSRRKKMKKTSTLVKKQKALRTNARHLVYEEAKSLKKQYSISRYSDPEDFPLDFDHDDTESRSKRRNRRACWKCDACLRAADCGRCDFCMDKPKFGGSNKKRQKCRLRQCQSQAMRHLLPFQLGRSKSMVSVGWMGRGRRTVGRSRIINRQGVKKLRETWVDFKMDDDDDDDESYMGTLPGSIGNDVATVKEGGEEAANNCTSPMAQATSTLNFSLGHRKFDMEELYVSSYPLAVQGCFRDNGGTLEFMKITDLPSRGRPTDQLLSHPAPEVVFNSPALVTDAVNNFMELDDDMKMLEVDGGKPEITPVITEIFSLASDGDADVELLRLLEALRCAVLPPHWVGVMTTGPLLQLLQCSKLSTMADTAVHIEPGFSYRVTVQEQPLLPSHRLYEAHPPLLCSTPEVAALLLDLEGHTVCQGYPTKETGLNQEPVLHVRAAACELLVPRSEERCDKCDVTLLVL